MAVNVPTKSFNYVHSYHTTNLYWQTISNQLRRWYQLHWKRWKGMCWKGFYCVYFWYFYNLTLWPLSNVIVLYLDKLLKCGRSFHTLSGGWLWELRARGWGEGLVGRGWGVPRNHYNVEIRVYPRCCPFCWMGCELCSLVWWDESISPSSLLGWGAEGKGGGVFYSSKCSINSSQWFQSQLNRDSTEQIRREENILLGRDMRGKDIK